jgi:NAD(P)-dependent dehydrogenase (short-subunit alcohol dehydrogenase family)
MSAFDLTGKVAIVTGASRGLGQTFARALAKAGADLAITSRTLDSLKAFQAEVEGMGRRVVPLELDVRDESSIRRMVSDAAKAFGRIDILVNNAGCNVRKPAVDVTWDDWNLILDTNLRGAFFVAQSVAREMIPRKSGRIINIGSVTSSRRSAGRGPRPPPSRRSGSGSWTGWSREAPSTTSAWHGAWRVRWTRRRWGGA